MDDTDKDFKNVELERLKKVNEQMDIEIAYRKVELQLLERELAQKQTPNPL